MKVMILGGSRNQLPLIQCAKEQGHEVVLCDYSEDVVGKSDANVFHRISTLDKEAVLDIAEKEKIDGIVTNSEPAMPTAAYVGTKLGLPSNPYESVVTLCRKDLFRSFLKANGFNCPNSFDADDYDLARKGIVDFRFPLMVKPVDSSGSRGVSRINSIDDLESAFENALRFSKTKRVVIEEFIERNHDYVIGGDIFVHNSEVKFWGLMNSMRDVKVNEFVPVGTSFPSFISGDQFELIKWNVQKILDLLKLRIGPFNLEIMFDEKGQLYFIEMNPRNGGNRIPEILTMATGVNLVEYNIKASLGLSIPYSDNQNSGFNKFLSTYIIHSAQRGVTW